MEALHVWLVADQQQWKHCTYYYWLLMRCNESIVRMTGCWWAAMKALYVLLVADQQQWKHCTYYWLLMSSNESIARMTGCWSAAMKALHVWLVADQQQWKHCTYDWLLMRSNESVVRMTGCCMMSSNGSIARITGCWSAAMKALYVLLVADEMQWKHCTYYWLLMTAMEALHVWLVAGEQQWKHCTYDWLLMSSNGSIVRITGCWWVAMEALFCEVILCYVWFIHLCMCIFMLCMLVRMHFRVYVSLSL